MAPRTAEELAETGPYRWGILRRAMCVAPYKPAQICCQARIASEMHVDYVSYVHVATGNLDGALSCVQVCFGCASGYEMRVNGYESPE
jgi:hypothetical protein